MTSQIIMVKMVHVRKAGMCSKGTRDFFAKHNLDWQEFLKVGIDSRYLEQTGDVMALQVVEVARNGR